MKKMLITLFAVMLAVTLIPFAKADTVGSGQAFNAVNITTNETTAGVSCLTWVQDTTTVESGITYTQFHTEFGCTLAAHGCVQNVEFFMPDLGFNETNDTTALAVTNITLYNTTFANANSSYVVWTGLLDDTLVNAEGYYIMNFTNYTTTAIATYAAQMCNESAGHWNATIIYYSTPVWVTPYAWDSVSGSTVSQYFNVTTNHSKNNVNFTGVSLMQMTPIKWYQRISGNTTTVYDTWGNSSVYTGSTHITVIGGSAGYLNLTGVEISGAKNNLSISYTITAASPSGGSGSSGTSTPAIYTPGTQAGSLAILLWGIVITLIVGLGIGVGYLLTRKK